MEELANVAVWPTYVGGFSVGVVFGMAAMAMLWAGWATRSAVRQPRQLPSRPVLATSYDAEGKNRMEPMVGVA